MCVSWEGEAKYPPPPQLKINNMKKKNAQPIYMNEKTYG